MAVVGGGQQRRPAVLRHLIDVRTFIDEQLRRFQIAFASRQHQRREPAATAADKAGDDDILIIVIIGGGRCRIAGVGIGRRRSCLIAALTLPATALAALTTLTLAGLSALRSLALPRLTRTELASIQIGRAHV